MSDVTDLKAEVLLLRQENKELRKERDFYCDQVTENGERARRAIDALNDENERLRELCEDIYNRFRGVVFECWAYSSEDFRIYERRMRELGVTA